MTAAHDLRAYGRPCRIEDGDPVHGLVVEGWLPPHGVRPIHVQRWDGSDTAIVRRAAARGYHETDAAGAPSRLVVEVEERERVAHAATPECARCHARPAGWLFARRVLPGGPICETCASREAAPAVTGPAVATYRTLRDALDAIEHGMLAGTDAAPRVLVVPRARLIGETMYGRTLPEAYAWLAPLLARRGVACAVDVAAAPEAPVTAHPGTWGRVREWWRSADVAA